MPNTPTRGKILMDRMEITPPTEISLFDNFTADDQGKGRDNGFGHASECSEVLAGKTTP